MNYFSAFSVSQLIYACTQCDILEGKKIVDVMLGRAGEISNWSTIIIVVNWVRAEKQLACVSTTRYSSPALTRLTFDQSPRTHRKRLAYVSTNRYSSPALTRLTIDQSPRTHRERLAYVSTNRYSSRALTRLTFDQSPRTHRKRLAYVSTTRYSSPALSRLTFDQSRTHQGLTDKIWPTSILASPTADARIWFRLQKVTAGK